MSQEKLSPLEAFYDLLSPIGLKEAGLKRYNLIETTLKNYEEGIKNSKSYKHRKGKEALFDLECLALKNTDKRYWKLPQQLADDVRNEMKTILKKNIELEEQNEKFSELVADLMEIDEKEEKKLKALEIMKTKLGIEKEDFFYDEVLGYMFVGNVVSKEEYELLKEVLL